MFKSHYKGNVLRKQEKTLLFKRVNEVCNKFRFILKRRLYTEEK